MIASSMLDPIANPSTAFGSAILSVRPALQRFALQLTKDHAAAEDLTQDTLARAWAARSRFEPGTNTKAWLFRIARNAFLSGIRRTRRQVAWDPDRHQMMLVQEATQDVALYARDWNAAFHRLTSVQQSVVLLIVEDDMSIADAANELGIPIGTVKSRISRARTAMLDYVAGDAAAYDERPAINRSEAGLTPPQTQPLGGDDVPLADRPTLSRYQRWKASGATMIG